MCSQASALQRWISDLKERGSGAEEMNSVVQSYEFFVDVSFEVAGG